jgi:Putative zinc-finger
MRTSDDPHRDAGPYALGVLDAADAYRFEDHLFECPHCSLQVTGFLRVRDELDAYVRCTPPGVPLFADAGKDLLGRTLRTVESAGRRSRRRRFALVAAAAVLVVGGPLGVLAVRPDQAPQQGLTFTGTDPVTGAQGVVTASARVWGTQVGFELSRPESPPACKLVAVGRDGSRETVTTWADPAASGQPVITVGGAAMRPDEIDHFEVRSTDGKPLVTLAG